jgi:hypothetical protein
MKKIIFLSTAFFVAVFFITCGNNSSKNNDNTGSTATINAADSNKLYACRMELTKEVSATVTSPVTENTATDTSDKQTTAPVTQSKFSVSDIVSNYLKLKNALTKDDANGAANAGKALYTSFANANTSLLDDKQKKEFADIADDAKEHGEHIGANAGKIDHQREHFAMLSKDINDLIKIFGAPQKLYQDFCPMYDDGKGAIWISETQEIKNPFFGSKMPTCGSVKKTY